MRDRLRWCSEVLLQVSFVKCYEVAGCLSEALVHLLYEQADPISTV
jgi:hypothetical protein